MWLVPAESVRAPVGQHDRAILLMLTALAATATLAAALSATQNGQQ